MGQTEAIALYQPLLYSIALKMTGKIADAEDLVQETFLNWIKIDPTSIRHTKAYLVRSIKNACSHHLSKLETRKTAFFDSLKNLEKVTSENYSEVSTKQLTTDALMHLHHHLGPLERGIFLLREAFGFDYEDLSELFDRTATNCRKILSRAKKTIKEQTILDRPTTELLSLFEQFKHACDKGELNSLIEKLKKDIGESLT